MSVNYSRYRIVAAAVLIESGAGVLAFLLSWYFVIPLFPVSESVVLDLLLGTAAALPPFAFFLFTLSEAGGAMPLIGSLRSKLLTDVKPMFSTMSVLDLLIISLLAGVAEELLFRGVLQVKYGIAVASVLFGLAHAVSVAYVVVTVIMGLYIGLIYRVSGSLLPPIQMHFIYDFAALLYLRYYWHPNGRESSQQNIERND